MSNRNKRNYNSRSKDKSKTTVGDKGKQSLKEIDDNSPIIKAFKEYATEIDERHDKYERLVKLSRDITIESKRIIFLLHNVDRENKKDEILREADLRLKKLVTTSFKQIAFELENQDPYQYLRAYTSGMQEFIEALTFHQYLTNNTIQDWPYVVQQLTYDIPTESETNEGSDSKIVKAHLPAIEYVLGIADLTGELMRKCINSLGAGNIDDCFTTCNFVKNMYTGFLMVGNTMSSREIGRKAYVLRQSLYKMESVCYNIVVRGSEVPKHMLANVIPTNTDVCSEEDEGFF